jgi:hypothetical protein
MTESVTKNQTMELPVSSKKAKLFPKPEVDPSEGDIPSTHKRMTGTKASTSKTKGSTSKKAQHDVTFADEVTEIENKENETANYCESSPTHISPSKQSLKSVKEHIKTPFSKVKEGDEEGTPLNKSLCKSNLLSGKKIDLMSQPDFNTEIANPQSARKEDTMSEPITTEPSQQPQVRSALKSALKQSLTKIHEAEVETSTSEKKCVSIVEPPKEDMTQVEANSEVAAEEGKCTEPVVDINATDANEAGTGSKRTAEN